MRFAALSGLTWDINLEEWKRKSDLGMEVISKSQDRFVLKDKNGFIFEIPEEILDINGIGIKEGPLILTESLYRYYCGRKIDEEIRFCNRILYNNFQKVLEKKDEILSVGQYFLFEPDFFHSGGVPGIQCGYTLGSLLEVWNDADYCHEGSQGEPLHPIHATGSFLSGHANVLFWSEEKKRFVSIGSENGLKGNYGHFFDLFKRLSDRYQIRLGDKLRVIKNLLNIIDISMSKEQENTFISVKKS